MALSSCDWGKWKRSPVFNSSRFSVTAHRLYVRIWYTAMVANWWIIQNNGSYARQANIYWINSIILFINILFPKLNFKYIELSDHKKIKYPAVIKISWLYKCTLSTKFCRWPQHTGYILSLWLIYLWLWCIC